MCYRTDDPIRDAERHMVKQEALLERFPYCESCGQAIQDDYFYLINDEFMCQACLDRDCKKYTDDYIA